jgi:putative transposase
VAVHQYPDGLYGSGSPWENGYIESFNGKLRDELLNKELLRIVEEAKALIERWRKEFNQIRPLSALGYKQPPPEDIISIALI